jgi:hypothetical protein
MFPNVSEALQIGLLCLTILGGNTLEALSHFEAILNTNWLKNREPSP